MKYDNTLVTPQLSPDGVRMAIFEQPTQGYRQVRMFNLDAAKMEWSYRIELKDFLHTNLDNAFSSDGKTYVTYRGREELCADIRDVATGEIKHSATFGFPAPNALIFSSGQADLHHIHTDFVRVVPEWRKWLADYLFIAVPADDTELLFDTTRRQCLGISRYTHYSRADPLPVDANSRQRFFRSISSDTIVTGDARHWGARDVCIWDLRGHGPWRWVLGIPAGLGVLIVASTWLLRWRNAWLARREAPILPAPPSAV